VNAFRYNLQRGPLPGLGEVPVDRQFRLRIEAHALAGVRNVLSLATDKHRFSRMDQIWKAGNHGLSEWLILSEAFLHSRFESLAFAQFTRCGRHPLQPKRS
jgi:hypothetical protein